ncbi:MAG: hypothetical protein Tsb008_03100 [Rhodothalassiaceae bacterium]
MYLVAIKSFYPHIGFGDIMVVNDGTLTDHDKELLAYHCNGIEIRDASSVDVGECPGYIAWRGLKTIIEESQQRYVVKLDSDVVVLDELPEIQDSIARNRSFVLGSFDCQEIWSGEQASDYADKIDSGHVQIMVERAFRHFPDVANLRYIRGCSGFAGIERGLYRWQDIEAFCREVEKHVDRDLFRSWGSEQVTVNYHVANSTDPLVLRWPRYTNHRDDIDIADAALIHFLGSWRFLGGRYVKSARQAVADLVARGNR